MSKSIATTLALVLVIFTFSASPSATAQEMSAKVFCFGRDTIRASIDLRSPTGQTTARLYSGELRASGVSGLVEYDIALELKRSFTPMVNRSSFTVNANLITIDSQGQRVAVYEGENQLFSFGTGRFSLSVGYQNPIEEGGFQLLDVCQISFEKRIR